jgi:hypothetical protein
MGGQTKGASRNSGSPLGRVPVRQGRGADCADCLALFAGLDKENDQKHGGNGYKQDACHETKIINLHSCLIRKSSSKINTSHHITRGGGAVTDAGRNAGDFVTLALLARADHAGTSYFLGLVTMLTGPWTIDWQASR